MKIFVHSGAALVVLLVLCSMSGGSAPPQKVPPLTRAEMQADLEHLTTCTKRAWAYAEDKHTLPGVDIDALHAAALHELDQAHDAEDFYVVVDKYVAGLMDGHAGVNRGHWPGRDSDSRRWPFTVARLDGRYYVKTTEAAAAPLRPGDELLSVNDVAMAERFETALARTAGSTAAGREYRAVNYMGRGGDKQVRVKAVRPGGSNFVCEMAAPRGGAGGRESIHWKKLEGNIGYVRLPSFEQDKRIWEAGGRGPEALQAALEAKKSALRQAFAELADTPALILDLRDNGGGSDALGHFLARCLCDTQAHPDYYTLATHVSEDLAALPDFAYLRSGIPAGGDRRIAIQILPEKDVRRYQGRLAVLMNEGCFSACDCFLNYLAAAAPQTVFVGRPNGAGAGAPRPVVTLPNSKIVVTFCVMQVWNLNGQLIESRPLKPTVPVQWTQHDLVEGRDPDLSAALDYLGRKGH
jgi:C-terminal processing protease CtpA/Prc